MMDLNTEEMVSAVKTMVVFLFKIDNGGIHMAVALMSQNITVQLHTNLLGSEICYLGTVVFLLVFCLIDVVTKKQQA